MNPKILLRTAAVLCVVLLPGVVRAADYAGNYESTKLSVVITRDGANYGGEIHMGDQTFPLTAHVEGSQLSGVFRSGGNPFPFTATQQGEDLTLLSGGATYQLHRHATSTQPANALATYVIMNTTDIGRSLVREIPAATSTRAALQMAFSDLAGFFGARPTILGAYEDQRDHKSAFVSFTAQLNGQPVKGFVTTKLRDQGGAVVFVVFGNADATRDQWARLTAAPISTTQPAGADDEQSLTIAMAAVPLKPYSFPDGTGAIGLAEGWTTTAQTESNLRVNGPAGQVIRMAFGGQLYTPNSMMVRQNQAGGLNLPVAPYSTDPATALSNIVRVNSAISQRAGGPAIALDRVINVKHIPARNPGGQGSQITYDITITDQNGPRHCRSFIQVEVSPPTNLGTWGYYVSLQLIAPVESFRQDFPVMMAQAFSTSENADAVMRKSQQEIAAARKLADAKLAANAKIAQSNYDRTQSVEENEKIKTRSLTDFDETIRGERTVEDTQTGERTSVNLGDVHDMVDRLNYQDPGRYREIPLRDEFYPMPGHENDPDYLAR